MILRRLKIEDAEGMMEWMHDPDIRQYFREDIGHKTKEDVLKFIKDADIYLKDYGDIHYAIANDTDEYMGTVSLKNISMKNKNAEYAISLRKIAQGRGIARAITQEILMLAFGEYGLHKVYLNVLSENKRAINLYEKIGFIYEGEFVEHIFLRGVYKSLRWYSILAEQFLSRGSN